MAGCVRRGNKHLTMDKVLHQGIMKIGDIAYLWGHKHCKHVMMNFNPGMDK